MSLVFRPQTILKLGLAVAIALTFGVNTACSQLIDPSTLQISGNNAGGTDPVQIDDSGLVTVNQNSGGAGALTNPWLLILGIPNDPTGSSEDYFGNTTSTKFKSPISVEGTGNSGALGGTNLYGGAWNADTGFAGTMTLNGTTKAGVSGTEAYTTIGLAGANNSNSFTNWAYGPNGGTETNPTGGDLKINKIDATSFNLYVFEINATLDGSSNTSVNIQFTKLPIGAYVIAYGQVPGPGQNTTVYDTPFTQAGLTTQNGGAGPGGNVITPAPPSAIVFSLGGLALLGFMAQSRRRLLVAA